MFALNSILRGVSYSTTKCLNYTKLSNAYVHTHAKTRIHTQTCTQGTHTHTCAHTQTVMQQKGKSYITNSYHEEKSILFCFVCSFDMLGIKPGTSDTLECALPLSCTSNHEK